MLLLLPQRSEQHQRMLGIVSYLEWITKSPAPTKITEQTLSLSFSDVESSLRKLSEIGHFLFQMKISVLLWASACSPRFNSQYYEAQRKDYLLRLVLKLWMVGWLVCQKWGHNFAILLSLKFVQILLGLSQTNVLSFLPLCISAHNAHFRKQASASHTWTRNTPMELESHRKQKRGVEGK